jgi:hypothetical protein
MVAHNLLPFFLLTEMKDAFERYVPKSWISNIPPSSPKFKGLASPRNVNPSPSSSQYKLPPITAPIPESFSLGSSALGGAAPSPSGKLFDKPPPAIKILPPPPPPSMLQDKKIVKPPPLPSSIPVPPLPHDPSRRPPPPGNRPPPRVAPPLPVPPPPRVEASKATSSSTSHVAPGHVIYKDSYIVNVTQNITVVSGSTSGPPVNKTSSSDYVVSKPSSSDHLKSNNNAPSLGLVPDTIGADGVTSKIRERDEAAMGDDGDDGEVPRKRQKVDHLSLEEGPM